MFSSFLQRIHRLVSGRDEVSHVPETVYPDDTFIVSYPKSGNTWMRFLIGNYLTGNECTFENCHQLTPDMHMNPGRCGEIDRPRFIKSHATYRSEYPNVVYIVRDGRDVAVSYYHYALKMDDIQADTSFSEFLNAFNQGEVGAFGQWSKHVHSWLDNQEDVLVVKYEDMLGDAQREFRKVLSFVGLTVEEGVLEEAVEASRFKKMRRQEEEQQEKLDVLRKSDKSKKFMRKGKKKDWGDYFSDEQLRAFIDQHGRALERLNYPLE